MRSVKAFERKINSAYEEWLKNPFPMTQKEIADAAGVNKRSISKIERRALKKLESMADRGWLS